MTGLNMSQLKHFNVESLEAKKRKLLTASFLFIKKLTSHSQWNEHHIFLFFLCRRGKGDGSADSTKVLDDKKRWKTRREQNSMRSSVTREEAADGFLA